jgi:hypothetical protein
MRCQCVLGVAFSLALATLVSAQQPPPKHKTAKNAFNQNQQMNYQYGGFGALYDPDVQKKLNLNDAQMKVLQENLYWNSQQLQNINKISAVDSTMGAQLSRQYASQQQQRFNQFLAPGQTKTGAESTGTFGFQPTFPPSRQ